MEKWLENWDMTSLKINLKFLEMEWQPRDSDKAAAWEMYIELLTRITTQPCRPNRGMSRRVWIAFIPFSPLRGKSSGGMGEIVESSLNWLWRS